MKFVLKTVFAAAAVAALSACGGGGGGGTDAAGGVSLKPNTSFADAQDASTKSSSSAAQKPDGTWTKVADENQPFTVDGDSVVQFGSSEGWTEKTITGAAVCSNAFFGTDPQMGEVKSCFVKSATVALSPAPAGDVVVSGSISPDAYRGMAAQMSKAAGLAYRYGPSAADYGSSDNGGFPTWSKPDDQSYDAVSVRRGGNRSCAPDGGFCGTWQLGGPLNGDSGDYSSSILHAAFVADEPSQRVGVSVMQAISMAHNTFAFKPEPSWALYDGALNTGLDEYNIKGYRAAGLDAKEPVALGRCYGRDGWCTTSLAVFQNGLIGTAGSNTARNKATAQLGAGKVPTSIAVTNSSEFALVTVWDTINLKGQVAVVALAGLCDGCSADNPGGFYDNWGEWNGVYPGLPNLGNIGYMKVLGYVDLPDSMKAPTEISVSTGVTAEEYQRSAAPGSMTSRNYWNLPLSDSNNRTSFDAGSNSRASARGGMAVVVSKSEQRAAFIDLRPLFEYYRQQYFQGSQSDFDARMSGRGNEASQWPYTFDAAGSQKPTVVKTIDLPNRPTAVMMTAARTDRALIATQDGQLHIYGVGNYLNAAGGGSADEIAKVGSVSVGRNPTHIAYVKAHGEAVYTQGPDREVIVTSRGDRRIDWVQFAGDFKSGSVHKSLRDSRMADPVAVEDANNHGTESYVLSVADFGGRQILNYRYGPTIFWTNARSGWNCQPPGGCGMPSEFEFGGSYATPGTPFRLAGANIP